MALAAKSLPANTGDVASVPELGRRPGAGNGNPLQSPARKTHGKKSLVATAHWSRRVGRDWPHRLTHRIQLSAADTEGVTMREDQYMRWSHALTAANVTALKHEERTYCYRTDTVCGMWEKPNDLSCNIQHLFSSCPGEPEFLKKKGKQMSDRKG